MHQPVDHYMVYVIVKEHENRVWYLHSIDKNTNANKWSRNPDNTFAFKTRDEATEVIEMYKMQGVDVRFIEV